MPTTVKNTESHPLRVRGLKLGTAGAVNSVSTVAPPAGAWIETAVGAPIGEIAEVAPPAGAWIETSIEKALLRDGESHPLRVRGLKPNFVG